MDQLNFQQQLAVEASDDPLLIVAGAGTGKTRTLTRRLIYLIEKRGVPPYKICALTFTNKAAQEMAERVERLKSGTGGDMTSFSFAAAPRGPYIGTFHSLGARILREEARALGRTPHYVIFDAQDSSQVVKKIVKGFDQVKETGASHFIYAISNIKNGLTSLAELKASKKERDHLLVTFFEHYEDALKKNNAFDFDDLIHKVVALWKATPECLAKYQRRFSHFLIDEYQDLNNTQYEFIQLLAGHTKNLSVVGDDQQTIYGWRGSNVRIFLNFETHWPKAQVVLLEQNYRSTAHIINAASKMIEHNRYQTQKTLWTKNPPGKLLQLIEAGNEDDEAEWVADQIETLAEEGIASTAILYRTNAQSRALEQSLLDRGIPYLIFGGIKFYERKEVKDVLGALRYALNPEDSISRERIEKAFTKTVFRALDEVLTLQGETSPRELIELVLRTTNYFGRLEKNFTNATEREENIAELLRFSSQFSDLGTFLERVSLLQTLDPLKKEGGEEKKPAVVLMTVHLAKGLEFDRVFVVGASEGLMPHARSIADELSLEEERRLLYVAMTRARKELTLSFYDLASRFISDIPEELLEFHSLISDTTPSLRDDEERYITLD